MTTERDLDIRLAAAAGIHDGDLPALPEVFLDHLHTLDGADIAPTATATVTAMAAPRLPRPTGTEPASVIAARQLVDDADAHARPRPRLRGRRSRVVRRPAVLLLAATAATAAVVVPLVATGGSPAQPPHGHTAPPVAGVNLLLADYSSTPTAASEQRLTEIQAACARGVAVGAGAGGGGDQSTSTIAETRDAWGLAVFNGKHNLGLCLTRHTGPHDDTVQSIAVKPAVTTAVSTGVSTDAVTHAQLGDPHQLGYTAAVGRTAPDVARVDVRLANGQTITATVVDGWWAAWWPNDDTPGLQATKLSYTTGDGRTVAGAFPGAD